MSETRPDFTGTLPPDVAAQVTEALESGPFGEPVKRKTKTIMWRGRAWQIRSKPGAVFLAEYEAQHLMGAAKAVLGEDQYADLLALDPDLEGDDGIDGFFTAANTAWGLDEGN